MPILLLFLYMAVIGLVAWLLITYIPMPAPIQTIIIIAAAICCVLLLLQAVGITTLGPTVPRIR